MFGNWFGKAASVVEAATDTVSDYADDVVDAISDHASTAVETIAEHVEVVDTVSDYASTAVETFNEAASDPFGFAEEVFDTATDYAVEAAESAKEWLGGGFDSGADSFHEINTNASDFAISSQEESLSTVEVSNRQAKADSDISSDEHLSIVEGDFHTSNPEIQAKYKIGEPETPDINWDTGFSTTQEPSWLEKAGLNIVQGELVELTRLVDVALSTKPIADRLDERVKYISSIVDDISSEFDNNHIQSFNNHLNTLSDLTEYMPDGTDALVHYIEGSGDTREFSFEKYINDDPSGEIALGTVVGDTQLAAEDFYAQLELDDTQSFKFTGSPLVSSENRGLPYPETQNWQKAIGGYHIWSSAEVWAEEGVDGDDVLTMDVTFNVEDRYNFDAGKKDIESGLPDRVFGRLEEMGLAKGYQQVSSFKKRVTWKQGNLSTTNIESVHDTSSESGTLSGAEKSCNPFE
ncbi:MAG: hypothetical protein ACFB0C_05725 [Leptolyngbyaceae cyanobacterium]